MRSFINDFYKWLYDRKNDHGYWKDLGGVGGVCYTEEAFISWLNSFVIKTSEKAVLVETRMDDDLTEEEQTYPDYNF